MLRENYPSDLRSEFCKLSLTIPLVDTVLGESKRRFESNQKYVFTDFYIIPYVMVASLKSPSKETSFLSFYEKDFEYLFWQSLNWKLSLWEHHWKNSVKGWTDNASSTLKQITFPSFLIIKRTFWNNLDNFGTMPVTCTYEKSFSLMKLLKIYLCTTMTNNRLNALALLNIHPDIPRASEEVLQRYGAVGPHRMEFD